MHEGKHGLLEGVEDLDELFGEEELEEEGVKESDCGCEHEHHHEKKDNHCCTCSE